THSPAGQRFQEDEGTIGLGLGVQNPGQGSNNQQFLDSGAFDTNNGIQSFIDNNEYLNQPGQGFTQGGLGGANYLQSNNYTPQFKQEDQSSPYNQPQQTSFTQELMGANLSPSFNDGDFALYSNQSSQNDQYDPSLFVNELSPPPTNQSINPAELNMSSPQHTPTPPNMLQGDRRSPSSAHQSPSLSQQGFVQNQLHPSPGHSRQTSLGPESAAFPQGIPPTDWGMLPPQFTGHRRTPSEYSDVSASSVHHSPNLVQHDTFDAIEQHHSPMQNPQDAGLYQEVLSIGNFSLSDSQIQHSASPRAGLTPSHSPAISPRLGPQSMPTLNQPNNFMLGMSSGSQSPTSYLGPLHNLCNPTSTHALKHVTQFWFKSSRAISRAFTVIISKRQIRHSITKQAPTVDVCITKP
ncbi:hypothetical protein DH86_00000007, partial [Scytalidium sp. 3C]